MPGNTLARTAVLACLAALFQLSAAFIPGPGHVLSALGTLPIFLVATESFRAGLAGLLVASALVFAVQPVEAPVLLFMTGPLGLTLGRHWNGGATTWQSAAVGGVVLAGGMVILTYAIGMPALGGLELSDSVPVVLVSYLAFAVFYSGIWVVSLRKLIPRLRRWLMLTG